VRSGSRLHPPPPPDGRRRRPSPLTLPLLTQTTQKTNSHLPHGLYEKQLLGFFSQFGRVSRVRVARSKRTARAKGYAYVEFAHQGVAEIAAEAMHGHLLLKQALSVRCLPKTEVHPELFKGSDRAFRAIPWGKIEAARHNAPRTAEGHVKRAKRAASRDAARRRKLAAAGVDYEYEDVLGKAAKEAAGKLAGGKKADKEEEAGKKKGKVAAKAAPPAAAATRKRRAAAAAEEQAPPAPAPALKKRAAASKKK
jgi:nucleolar protein 15